jgi:hypothetical protein
MRKAIIVALVCIACFASFKVGRTSMYDDMIQAAGGIEGSKLQVLLPNNVSIYHEASTCAVCHGG